MAALATALNAVTAAAQTPATQPPTASAHIQAPADLVLLHGRIHTEDARRSVAEAIAVRGNTLIAVGTNQDVAALVGPQTRTVDLDGLSCPASSTLTLTLPTGHGIWTSATWATRC